MSKTKRISIGISKESFENLQSELKNTHFDELSELIRYKLFWRIDFALKNYDEKLNPFGKVYKPYFIRVSDDLYNYIKTESELGKYKKHNVYKMLLAVPIKKYRGIQ